MYRKIAIFTRTTACQFVQLLVRNEKRLGTGRIKHYLQIELPLTILETKFKTSWKISLGRESM